MAPASSSSSSANAKIKPKTTTTTTEHKKKINNERVSSRECVRMRPLFVAVEWSALCVCVYFVRLSVATVVLTLFPNAPCHLVKYAMQTFYRLTVVCAFAIFLFFFFVRCVCLYCSREATGKYMISYCSAPAIRDIERFFFGQKWFMQWMKIWMPWNCVVFIRYIFYFHCSWLFYWLPCEIEGKISSVNDEVYFSSWFGIWRGQSVTGIFRRTIYMKQHGICCDSVVFFFLLRRSCVLQWVTTRVKTQKPFSFYLQKIQRRRSRE